MLIQNTLGVIVDSKKYTLFFWSATVLQRVEKRFPPEDVKKLEEMLQVISRELMPEIPIQVQNSVPE